MNLTTRRNRIGTLVALLLAATSLSACSSPTAVTNHLLRISNTGSVAIQGLQVLFPDETLTFGSVLPGATTTYVAVSRGVYGYSAFRFTVDGATIAQPVIDWVGEEPLDGTTFTYVVELTKDQPGRPAHFIRIERVIRDQ